MEELVEKQVLKLLKEDDALESENGFVGGAEHSSMSRYPVLKPQEVVRILNKPEFKEVRR